MNILQSIVLGLIQGLTEFLPVSSSGHLIIVRDLFGWNFEQSLAFDVFIHLATLLAIIVCFWGDIKRIFKDFASEGFSSRSKNLLGALILGCVPAVIAGYYLSHIFEELLRRPDYVAYALIAGSIVFFFADQISKLDRGEGGGVNWIKGLFIGVFQMFALIPGVSRSGITISGGLFFGLSREEAIKFAFLLGIPIIAGAGLRTLLTIDSLPFADPAIWAGFVAAFISGLWAAKFLVKYLAKHSFTPFIVYRILLAGAILYFL
jgi:undecaprenyl-diphosphatase